jgi:hypothetical protein
VRANVHHALSLDPIDGEGGDFDRVQDALQVLVLNFYDRAARWWLGRATGHCGRGIV